MQTALQQPQVRQSSGLLLAGLRERYTRDAMLAGIPHQWQRFAPMIGRIAGQVGTVAYGVCANEAPDGTFDYYTAVEVRTRDGLPAELTALDVPERAYAVFEHRGHIATIGDTWGRIYKSWLPAANLQATNAPEFERYDERFDPRTRNGIVEIWIPLVSGEAATPAR